MAPSSLQTGHIGINVTDVDRSTAFYTRVFGLQVLREGADQDRRFAYLGRDGQLLVTLWQQATGGYRADRAGLHHLSFQVPTIADVRAAERTLLDLGADFADAGRLDHGDGADQGELYFTDPDGTRLELYSATPPDTPAPPAPADAPTCGFF
jgi:catechol-2,3-dioxygenase